MDQVIWVEVLSRHRTVQSRHRCTGPEIRIGRAYTNDVIVDDPFVAPEHARLSCDAEGRVVVTDLGTANGLHAAHSRQRSDRLALGDDGVFRIGHTYLRVRDTAHAVAPERQFAHSAGSWVAIAVLAVAVLAFEAASLWLGDYSEPRVSTYMVPLLGGSIMVGLWSGMWSIVSRIFFGTARFEQNLLIALGGALGFEMVGALSSLGAFGLSWSTLVGYNFVGLFGVVAAICFIHLRQINPARSALAASVVSGIFLGAVAIQMLMQSDARPVASQLYVRNLLPPSLRLAPVANEASFFSGVEKLRGQLDEDRAKEP